MSSPSNNIPRFVKSLALLKRENHARLRCRQKNILRIHSRISRCLAIFAFYLLYKTQKTFSISITWCLKSLRIHAEGNYYLQTRQSFVSSIPFATYGWTTIDSSAELFVEASSLLSPCPFNKSFFFLFAFCTLVSSDRYSSISILKS